MNTRLLSAALVAGTTLLAAVPDAQAEAEWLIAPYIWAPTITLNQDPGDGSGTGTGENLLDKLDTAGLIRIEAASGNWGAMLDYIYVSFSDDERLNVGDVGLVDFRTDLNVSVLELGGFYRFSGQEDGVHLLFGYRGIDIETSVLATPPGSATQRTDTDATLNDVFLGARYLYRFNERWDFTIRGDYSFGDTDGVLNALTSVGFRFTKNFAMNLGYRYSDLKYEVTSSDGDTLDTEVEFSGPLLGFLFRFDG